MLSRRTLILLLSLVLPLAACSAPTEAPKLPRPTRSAFDGKAAIAASLSGIDAGVYSFAVTASSGSINGILHAPSRSLETESRQQAGDLEVTSRTLLIGDRQYLNMAAGGAGWDELLDAIAKFRGKKLPMDVRETYELLGGETWISLPSEPRDADLTAPDALGVKALMSHVKSARGSSAGGNNQITGTIDVSRLNKSPDLLGSMAKLTVPAQALAAEPIRYAAYIKYGKLSMLELTMPGGAGTWIVEVNDYGTAHPAPAPPAAKVKKLSPKELRPFTDGDPVLA
ncbi:hypothetical protein AB0M54_14595 [Actinoplanes sp. NPDC051470]|uniref:hypothetical protein n=1 Tax=Actinoplanes sp. NPDC051470 TaxID=3157224 RepID=UPI003435FE14